MAHEEVVLAARGITKIFPGAVALDRVDFSVRRGKVNVLVGENGAGKSTLVKILAGAETPTAGRLVLDGRELSLSSTRDAEKSGIGMIYQELNLCRNMSVVDNVFLAHERTRGGVIGRRVQERIVRELMARLEQPIRPGDMVGDLPLGRQQIVEIAKALARNVRILIMDEPTSALSAAEVAVLFRIIGELKSRGVSIIYISHRLEEVLAIGDHITVLRDGRLVAEAAAAEINVGWIIEMMTGRARRAPPASPERQPGREVLKVTQLSLEGPSRRRILDRVNLNVRQGEILGIYGLMGAGRTELFEVVAGLRRQAAGGVEVDGVRLDGKPVSRRLRAGLVLVPEDRQAAGLVQTLSVGENLTLASLSRFARSGCLSIRQETAAVNRMIRELAIRTAGPRQPVTALSGGNQQKVVIGKCLLASPKVLLLDEPTRGVDIGARAEIYGLMRGLAARGLAIAFTSSDLGEILAVATRILVLSKGRITAEFEAGAWCETELVAACSASAEREPWA